MREPTATRLSGRTGTELERAMHLVTPDGAVFAGAAATRKLFQMIPWGRLLRMPSRFPVRCAWQIVSTAESQIVAEP